MVTIKIRDENLHSQRYSEPSALLPNQVNVWRAQISSYVPFLNKLNSTLSEDELTKTKKYHQLKDAQNFVVRRGLLRFLLARYIPAKPSEIDFSTGHNGKPIINGDKVDFHFNTSHSNDLVLFAFSNVEIGIDVEYVCNDFNYDEILYHSFSPDEILVIKNDEKPRETFFRFWTRKEALLKATAKGLDNNLPRIPSTDGTHKIESELLSCGNSWDVRSFKPLNSYEASLAYPPEWDIRLMECNQNLLF